MVSDTLKNYIESQEQRGVSDEELRSALLEKGWDKNSVDSALGEDKNPSHSSVIITEPKKSNKKVVIIASIIIIVVVATFFMFFYIDGSKCGDSKVSKGETWENCCVDAGCLGDSNCVDNACIEPECGDCQYLDEHLCKEYECCDEKSCGEGKICESNSCVELICGDCEYIKENECVSYTCCSDEECDGVCKNPSSIKSECATAKELNLSKEDVNKSITLNEVLEISFNSSKYLLSVENVDRGNTSLSIDNKSFNLGLWEEYAVDFNNDELGEMVVTLVGYTSDGLMLNIKEVACKKNADCDDNITTTEDSCSYPGTTQAECAYSAGDECETNADCDDELPWTYDLCYTVSPSRCINTVLSECEDDDGYCPENCFNNTDNDCENANECDYDTDCDDSTASTRDYCITSSHICMNVDITECVDTDGYCPTGCNATTDANC